MKDKIKKRFLGKYQIAIIALWIIGLAAAFAIKPRIQDVAVLLIGRELNNPAKWQNILNSLMLIYSFLSFCLYLGTTFRKEIMGFMFSAYFDFKECFLSFKNIFNHKFVLYIAAFLLLAYSSIFRANFSYNDDMNHVLNGFPEWAIDFARWVQAIFNVGLQPTLTTTMVDISPLQQILCVLFLSLSIMICSNLFSQMSGNKRVKTSFIIVSSIIAINPYFLECVTYRFDSVGMGFSILLSFFPFIFLESRKAFLTVSFVCNFLMCLTYQASSGIYVIVVIFSGFLKYICFEDYKFRDLVLYYFQSCIAFVFANLFYFLIFSSHMLPYRSIDIGSNIISTLVKNCITYFRDIMFDFNRMWSISLLFAFIASSVAVVLNTKRNKIISLILFFLLLFFSAFLSFGIFLLLDEHANSARMMYGFGVYIAIIALIPVLFVGNKLSRVLAIFSFLIFYLFFSFCFVYGNALLWQDKYEKTFEEMILYDLANQNSDSTENEMIWINGSIGIAPAARHMFGLYPILHRMVPLNMSDGWWGGYHLTYFYDDSYNRAWQQSDHDSSEDVLVHSNKYYKIFETLDGYLIDFK